MPGAEWYVVVGDNEQGPFTAPQLKQFADQGKLRPEMQVRKEGMEQHVQAQAIKGLFPAAGAAAPQPAPAPAQQAPPQPQPAAPPPPPEEDIPPPEEVPVGGDEEPASEPAPAQAGSGRRSRRGRGTGDGGAGGRSRRTGGGGARSRRGGGRGSRRRGGAGDDEDPRRAKKKGGLNPLIIVAVAVVVLAGAGAGLYFGGVLDGSGPSLDGTWNLDVEPIMAAMEKEAEDEPGAAMGLGLMRMVMGPFKIMDIVVDGNQVHIPDPNSGEVKTAKLEILSRDGNKFRLKLHPPPDQEGEDPVEFSVTLKGERASIDPPEDVAAKMKQSGVPMDMLGFTRKSTSTAKPKVPSKEELQEAMGGGGGGLTPPPDLGTTPPDGDDGSDVEDEEGAPAIPDEGTGE